MEFTFSTRYMEIITKPQNADDFKLTCHKMSIRCSMCLADKNNDSAYAFFPC